MDLVNRLKYYLNENKIAISQFADKCRIPRPTLSQILNGRNKKVSDELISKIHDAYPDLSVLWLMFGEGDMVTRANTRISEAENSANGADSTIQNADTSTFTPGSATYGETFEPGSENNFEHYPASDQAEEGVSYNLLELCRPDKSLNILSDAYDPQIDERQRPGHQSKATLPGIAPDFATAYNEPAVFHATGSPYDAAANIHTMAGPTQSEESVTTEHTSGQHKQSAQEESERYQPDDANKTSATISREPGSIVFINTNQNEATDKDLGRTQTYPATDNDAPNGLTGEQTFAVPTAAGKKISNIVVFYTDNSFQSFTPAN